MIKKGAFAGLAKDGATFSVRATPGANAEDLKLVDDVFHIRSTVIAEGGKANKAIGKALARALGVAPSRLSLISGATARDKVFRLD